MKTFTSILNSLMVGLFVCLVAVIAMNHSAKDSNDYHEYHVPTRLEKMFISGECWTGGEGHPLPTRLVLNDGTVKVMAPGEFDKALSGGIDNLHGFCK